MEDSGIIDSKKELLRENALKNTESYVAKAERIFIDTCSLMYNPESVDVFFANLIPLLRKYERKIIAPMRVVEELQKHRASDDEEKKQRSEHGLQILVTLQGEKLLDIFGDNSDGFADHVFQSVFIQKRPNLSMMLITQDINLAQTIDRMNEDKSVRAKEIYVKKITRYGYLGSYKWDNLKPVRSGSTNYNGQVSEMITGIPDVQNYTTKIPGENDIVICKTKRIRLKRRLATGGEGIVYETETPYVAKIYKKENNTRRKLEKLKLMLTKQIDCEGICYPKELLYNEYGQFVGFLMPKAKGKEIQRCLFIKPLLLKNFPDWKKRDTVQLCVTILKKIQYLHDNGIIIGDINPANILIVSSTEIYFVDTDSYQIGPFPCPVGTINFTAPEIQGKRYTDFLRSFGNEYFAVATLLFMIMLPGKPPYSQQGGESQIENIKRMDFSYPLGERTNKKTPDGPWRYIWSHLTYDIKESFYNTFRRDGKNNSEQTRLTVADWLEKFVYYLELLDSGKYGLQDKMSEELFPTRFKKNPNSTYIKCRLCNEEVDKQFTQDGICQTCLNIVEYYQCKRCNKVLKFSNYSRYIKKKQKHEFCPDCYQWTKQYWKTAVCVDCGNAFILTNYDNYLHSTSTYAIPKRCSTCRERRKRGGYQ